MPIKVRIYNLPITGMLSHCSCGVTSATEPRYGRNVCSPLTTPRHSVAEERGHRDAAVLDLGVAKVAGGLVVVERRERHARAAERVQKPGFRPSDEPSARSISSSRADEVSIDERGAARRNGECVGDRSRPRTDRATAVTVRIFG